MSSTKQSNAFAKKPWNLVLQWWDWVERRLWQSLSEAQRTQILVMLGAIILLSVIKPFSTSSLPLFTRIFYWTTCLVAGFAGRAFCVCWFDARLIRARASIFVRTIVSTLSVTAVVMLTVCILEAWLNEPLPPRYLLYASGCALTLTSAIHGVMLLGLRHVNIDDPLFEDFRASWPADLRDAALLALEAQDHYVGLHTTAGHTLLSMRFRDALNAVSYQSGSQVHRSWWVADNAVKRFKRNGGHWQLALTNDLQVPVSRGFRAKVGSLKWDQR